MGDGAPPPREPHTSALPVQAGSMEPEPPEVTVFPKEPVELGQSNTLICHVDRFFPPALNVTWLRNGELIIEDIAETIFLPTKELRFHRFPYLTLLPTAEDICSRQGEHWGLHQPLLRHWGMERPPSAITALAPPLFPGPITPQHLLSSIPCFMITYPNFTISWFRIPSTSNTRGQSLLSAPCNSVFPWCTRGPGTDPGA
nr:H-2 class II histocompatibility antigen, A-D alpha chain-like [Macaca fascicularis]